MPLTEDPKLHDLVTRLRQSFAPIHAAWLLETKPATSDSADTVLHNDIVELGLFISAHDKLSATVEKQLLAELVSFFTPSLDEMPYDYILNVIDAQIEKLSATYTGNKEWPELASLAMAKSWAGDNAERKTKAQTYVGFFSGIANQFILRDGRVTDEEIKFLNDFDAHFAIA